MVLQSYIDMKKTLILCFIHGFKGDESTFGDEYRFVQHLEELVAEALPKLTVKTLVYPKFETRGDLGETVSRFRNWLEEKIIDLEVSAHTPSPTIDPSVRTILIGHSMGGIVAAETVLGIATDEPIYTEDGIEKNDDDGGGASFNALMFPYIQGVLAFDTPYLGIAPGVVAYNAEGHYQNAQAAFSTLSTMWAGGGGRGKKDTTRVKSAGALPAPPSPPPPPPPSVGSSSTSGGGSSGAWGKWGKMAMYAGAASAVAATGAAAWMKRDQISQGWGWVYSHLEFVGCLARGEELRKRVGCMVRLNRELGVGFANLYTRLGNGDGKKGGSSSSGGDGSKGLGIGGGGGRTFCSLPPSSSKKGEEWCGEWREAVNDWARDETAAHMNMFDEAGNSGYERLGRDAVSLIVGWMDNEWHKGGEGDVDERSSGIGEEQVMMLEASI